MRPRPEQLFFFSLSLAEAAVFRRDGFQREVRQLPEKDGITQTVTETLRQTITVNGAGAAGPPNATITETVTVSVNIDGGANVLVEGTGKDLVGDEAFEGVRLSLITETVLQTQEPLTETVVAEASTVTETLPGETITVEGEGQTVVETVTAPGEAQTVIETVTGSCPGGGVGNGSIVTPGAPDLGVLPTGAPEVIIAPNPNGDGNGVGVSTVPIAEGSLPRTTLTYDPLAAPVDGTPAPLEPPVATPAPEPAPAPAPEEPASPPAPENPEPITGDEGPEPVPAPGVPATTAPADPAVTESPQNGEEPAAGEGGEGGEGEQEEDESGEEDSSDEEEKSDEEESDGDDDEDEAEEKKDDEAEEDNEEPDASAPADSVVEGDGDAPDATEQPSAPEPELPPIDVSSLTLESQIDLGGLVPRTEAPGPQATDQA